MAKLRLAVITDIHYGIDDRAKLGSKAPELMEAFTKAVNRRKPLPSLVVDMGDRVSARNSEDDAMHMTSLTQHFNKLAVPVVSIMGNHDISRLTPDQNEKITGSPATHHSMDIEGHHLVFFNPVGTFKDRGALRVTKDDLKWLKEDLENTDKPTIVFSHVPLDNVSETQAEKGYGEYAHKFGYPKMGKHIRKIMENSGNVVLCMSGNIHCNRYREINGIHYVSQQSFTHQYKEKYRGPSRAWSLIDIDDDKIKITRYGKPKKISTLDIKPS